MLRALAPQAEVIENRVFVVDGPLASSAGITAGIGGLAYAGIPVTHRDTNHAVTFITGHGVDGKLTHLDWAAVSRGAPTLVFYMARKANAIVNAPAAALDPVGRGVARTRMPRLRPDGRVREPWP